MPIDCVVGERTDRMQFTELQGAINTAPRMYALPWFPGVTSPAFIDSSKEGLEKTSTVLVPKDMANSRLLSCFLLSTHG